MTATKMTFISDPAQLAQDRANTNKDARAKAARLRTEMRAKAQMYGIGIVHIFDEELPRGGLTVAFKKSSDYKSGRMVECAVAVCSVEDTFSKKTGTTIAVARFLDGETINLPILINSWDRDDVNGAVKQAFTAFYKAVAQY